ncbi:MAG: carboxypeptidase-like regulatory domain-containing protein, partial [Chitinophagaceae bacterium]
MKKLFLLTAIIIAGYSFAYAQKNITGKVTSKKDGTPLAGVSVIVKNGGGATQTDPNGNFSLANVPANTKIVFSLVSYKTFESSLPSGNSMDITLEESSQQLSEVVVTALGIRREKKALGYAVATVDKKQLESRPDGDLGRLLSGKAPGVDILATSGISGSGTNIQI